MMNKTKILIVDDKPENLYAIEIVLKGLDIELIKATSGNDALKATLYHDFALALLDVQMPGMDGYELASILREEEKTARLPFIFISAVYTDNLNVFKGYEKGAFSFITKPFRPEILINKVKFFIEKHQQEIAVQQLNLDLQKKNAELQYINKELESFSYSVSHDLRTPLRAINGFAQMLDEDYHDLLDEEGRRLLSVIRDNAKKMGMLIDDLLNFSRLGRTGVARSKIDMQALVHNVVEELNRTMPNAAEFIFHDLVATDADPAMMRQVMMNLLANAVKYSSKCEKPVIRINSERNEEAVIYHVGDNGVGFDNQYAHKLFGVFQRLHSPADFEGTGVGLALVQRIVHKHGGRVWAEGEVNKGAVFSFSLPDQN